MWRCESPCAQHSFGSFIYENQFDSFYAISPNPYFSLDSPPLFFKNDSYFSACSASRCSQLAVRALISAGIVTPC